MKKTLAILLSAVMLLGIFTGCSTTPAVPTTMPTETIETAEPTAIGMLTLNANATVEVLYDADGLVLAAEGTDENGIAIAKALGDPLGQTCSDALTTLYGHSVDAGYITEDTKSIVIKQAFGSQQPSDTFLQNLTAELQTAAEAVTVITVSVDELDSNGYIGTDKAKEILATHLGLDADTTIEGNPAPTDEIYSFTITTNLATAYYAVNANTGLVTEGAPEADPDTDLDTPTGETTPDSTTPVTVETIPEDAEDTYIEETVQETFLEETEPAIPEETEVPQTIPEDI